MQESMPHPGHLRWMLDVYPCGGGYYNVLCRYWCTLHGAEVGHDTYEKLTIDECIDVVASVGHGVAIGSPRCRHQP